MFKGKQLFLLQVIDFYSCYCLGLSGWKLKLVTYLFGEKQTAGEFEYAWHDFCFDAQIVTLNIPLRNLLSFCLCPQSSDGKIRGETMNMKQMLPGADLVSVHLKHWHENFAILPFLHWCMVLYVLKTWLANKIDILIQKARAAPSQEKQRRSMTPAPVNMGWFCTIHQIVMEL